MSRTSPSCASGEHICGVPQRLSQLDTATQHFDLVGAAGWGIGGGEFLIPLRDEIFIVTVPQDGFEDVLALAHKSKNPG